MPHIANKYSIHTSAWISCHNQRINFLMATLTILDNAYKNHKSLALINLIFLQKGPSLSVNVSLPYRSYTFYFTNTSLISWHTLNQHALPDYPYYQFPSRIELMVCLITPTSLGLYWLSPTGSYPWLMPIMHIICFLNTTLLHIKYWLLICFISTW